MYGSGAEHTWRMRHGLLWALLFLVACSTHANASVLCHYSGLLCVFGRCTFSKESAGALSRTGTCASTVGALHLDGKGTQSLSAGVFEGLVAVEYLSMYDNSLTSLPAGVFDGLTALKLLYVYSTVELSCVPILAVLRSRLFSYSGLGDTSLDRMDQSPVETANLAHSLTFCEPL